MTIIVVQRVMVSQPPLDFYFSSISCSVKFNTMVFYRSIAISIITLSYFILPLFTDAYIPGIELLVEIQLTQIINDSTVPHNTCFVKNQAISLSDFSLNMIVFMNKSAAIIKKLDFDSSISYIRVAKEHCSMIVSFVCAMAQLLCGRQVIFQQLSRMLDQ